MERRPRRLCNFRALLLAEAEQTLLAVGTAIGDEAIAFISFISRKHAFGQASAPRLHAFADRVRELHEALAREHGEATCRPCSKAPVCVWALVSLRLGI